MMAPWRRAVLLVLHAREFFEVEGASVGTQVYVAMFYSDFIGECYYDGIFLTQKEAEESKGNCETWDVNLPDWLKDESAELHILGAHCPLPLLIQ